MWQRKQQPTVWSTLTVVKKARLSVSGGSIQLGNHILVSLGSTLAVFTLVIFKFRVNEVLVNLTVAHDAEFLLHSLGVDDAGSLRSHVLGPEEIEDEEDEETKGNNTTDDGIDCDALEFLDKCYRNGVPVASLYLNSLVSPRSFGRAAFWWVPVTVLSAYWACVVAEPDKLCVTAVIVEADQLRCADHGLSGCVSQVTQQVHMNWPAPCGVAA